MASAAPKDPKAWLLAIAVEKYDSTSPVIYSAKSGEAFVATAEKLLGIPKENIVFLRDNKATTGAVKDAVLKISERAEPGDTIYFYYSGHGIPDPASSEAFILPKDKSVEYVGKEPDLKMRQIYQTLEKSKAAKVVAIVDACFSGMTDGTAVYKGVAAAHFKPKAYIPTPKMVILTAGIFTAVIGTLHGVKYNPAKLKDYIEDSDFGTYSQLVADGHEFVVITDFDYEKFIDQNNLKANSALTDIKTNAIVYDPVTKKNLFINTQKSPEELVNE